MNLIDVKKTKRVKSNKQRSWNIALSAAERTAYTCITLLCSVLRKIN